MSQATNEPGVRPRPRLRWLTAVGLSLGITTLSQAQQVVWRPIAQSAPSVVIASAVGSKTEATTSATPPPRPTPVAMLGRPVAIAASVTPMLASTAAGKVSPTRSVIRGQAPDLDSGSPFPPPANALPAPTDPTPPGTQGFGPYTPHEAARFNAPQIPGLTSAPGESGTTTALTDAAPTRDSFTPAVSIGMPHGAATQPVSATVPASGLGGEPIAGSSSTSAELGTAPPQPLLPIVPHSVHTPPDSVPPPGGVPAPDINTGVLTDQSVAPSFWEKCKDWVTVGDRGTARGRTCFQSDHGFEGMVSPITMPFYFEDSRSLTEIRPIFMYQSIPKSAPNFGGGSAYFFGTQARVAFTERFSVVMSELGFISLDPKNAVAPVTNSSGFSEIKIGPKYTFWRDTCTGTVAAAGLNFELPVGDRAVFQNVGSFSMDPYVSFGQSFGQLGGYGSLNFLSTTGYSFSVNNKRSEFFYTNLHLDWNVAKANTFFPLIELNWMHYTGNATSNDLNTEGADLINFGSTRRGRDFIALAAGLRYRFNENIQTGGAIQFPVSYERGLQDFRLTFDVIFRY